MSISVCKTYGSGRDSLLLPLLSFESWMFMTENPDRKKRGICQKYQRAETKNARKVVTPIRKAISLDLSLDKYFDQYVPNDLANRLNNWKYFFIQKYIKHVTIVKLLFTIITVVHKSTNRETSVTTYISLKLYSSIWSKMLLQSLHQTGIFLLLLSFNRHNIWLGCKYFASLQR